jgi:hypothetical protein
MLSEKMKVGDPEANIWVQDKCEWREEKAPQ